MVLVKFFADFGFGFCLEVFIDALIVLIRATAIRDFAVTRGKVLILQCCSKNGSGLGFPR